MVYPRDNYGIGDDPPDFEYDAAKSQMNAKKHGIDFEQAKGLWEDPNRVETPARSEGEPRYMVVARVSEQLWAAFVTYRGDRVRIISVRRARPREISIYEEG